MCYTAKDSALAYGVNLVGCAALFLLAKDAQFKVLALFLLFVGQMQIFDYYFWNHQKCDKENNIVTKLAIAVNHYQPSVLFLLQHLYGFKQSIEAIVVLGIYSILSVFYNAKAFEQINCTLPKDGILEWKWNELDGNVFFYAFYILYFVVASFNFTDTPVKIASALISVITFVAASQKRFLNIHFGRAWCYYAALMPLVFLVLNYLV
jgi:hypothetical protein